MARKQITIVAPVYNEEANLDELFRRLKAVFAGLPEYQFDAVLVDNGSHDSSWEKIEAMHAEDPRFKGLQLSRNFTAPGGITAGLRFAKGDAVIVMCSDLQDPPEKIPLLVEKWEDGYDVAYQVVTKREGIGFFYNLSSKVFHRLMFRLTKKMFPENGTVFRLMDAKVVAAYNQLKETNRYFPGLCNWIGYKSIGVEFERARRFAGEAKSQWIPIATLALNAIFSYSYLPLRLVTIAGSFLTIFSGIYSIYLITSIALYGIATVPGLAAVTTLLLFMFGFLFFFIGIIGEYLARIYDEVKQRPNFLIRNTLGVEIHQIDSYSPRLKKLEEVPYEN